MGSFWPMYIMFELKKYGGVIFHYTEKWCKIWRKTDCGLKNYMRKFGNFSPEHSKVSKLGLWWGPFFQSGKCISLKFTEELCVMTMTNDAKFEEELTCHFKIDIRNLMNFDPSTWKSKKIALQLPPLTKVYNVWAKKVQRSYVWWHWRLMQNLKENWLVLSKMTWGIWQIWIAHLTKNFQHV